MYHIPSSFWFTAGCVQQGEYVMKRTIKRVLDSREVAHVPTWRCTALVGSAPRPPFNIEDQEKNTSSL